jgi:hypothetical protein
MVTLVNFADKNFKNKQKWNTISGKLFGGFDDVLEYRFEDIDEHCLSLNKENLKYKEKGAGNYFWKPYIVKKGLEKINKGEYLMYADSGSIFLKNVKPLIKFMEKNKKDIFCFKLPLIEKQWTKRDAFILMGCDSSEYTDTPQVLATYFLIKKSAKSIQFIEEYEKYCFDNRVLSDDPNALGKSNYPGFIEHRHDQSILSLLCKKNNVLVEPDISDYGYFPYKYTKEKGRLFDKKLLNHKENKLKGILLSNRNANPFIYLFKYYIRRTALFFGIKI